ncbi:MAG TPA: hypothetical protein VGM49_01545 [Candidatus Limnocylindrales bacterium]|jgi:hypothetical protein
MTMESTSHQAPRQTPTNGSRSDKLGQVADAVHEVRSVLEDAGRSVPTVVKASRSAASDVYRAIDAGSDERISAGVTLTLGLAIGMLIGSAPRLLIALTLAPLVAMGLVLADRRATAARSTTARSAS